MKYGAVKSRLCTASKETDNIPKILKKRKNNYIVSIQIKLYVNIRLYCTNYKATHNASPSIGTSKPIECIKLLVQNLYKACWNNVIFLRF